MDIPKDWPHTCGSRTTWIVENSTKYRVICSFCKKVIGFWTYTSADKKIYPQGTDSKFSTSQKHLMT